VKEMANQLKRVALDNIENEHICCAITEKKVENCVALKKAWLKDRMEEGLVFLKMDVRGKVFIEYLPAEVAHVPVVAPDYMYINCFWVSGKYKGQGHASQLLEACIQDTKEKGKKGLVILSSKKKMPFLSDPKFLKYKGFKVCDTAYNQYELLYLPFEEAVVPKFRGSVRQGEADKEGIVLYYSNQCPHAEKYACLIESIARDKQVPFKRIKLEDRSQAQASPAPFTTYSIFVRGDFVTNEILTEKKFLALLDKYNL
jgi:ribosomal protein S18 acetylase RimI-like enzyme